ncbi:MAG: Hsp20/alpha crystallin family protein [Candidatus Omnitrophica bacterium]|nr:Hsp20/alpha crystallin family protein [Candidatus Omnitrophota bacterium]
MNEKGNVWLYIIVAILAILLVLETGIIIVQRTAKSRKPFMQKAEEAVRPFTRGLRQAMPRSGYTTQQGYGRTAEPGEEEWNPFAEMRTMQQMINRMLEESLSRGYPYTATRPSPLGSQMGRFTPSIDLKETDTDYVVTADIPGASKDKINVSIRNNMLTISGERSIEEEKQEGGFYSQERSYGSFSRTINLPGAVDENNIKADYLNGVLTITLPKLTKAAPEEPKKVVIS